MGDEDEGGSEGADDAEEVAGELDAAGEDYAEREGDEGEVCSGWVVDVEEEAIG